MNIKIFVHGVPAGHDIWGKDLNERIYFNKFYNTKFSDKVKFLIEKNNNYCYYNYLVYQNVLGSGDRSGSYFGISLQVNAYCKDILKIYNILDTIYSLYVQGNILEEVNGKLKYKISSFNSVERLLNEIAGEIIELLKQKGLSDNSFMPLNNIEKSNANYAFLNLYEFSSNTIYDYFKKNGIVALSPYYPTQKENKIQKDCQQQIANAKNECQKQLAQKDAECKQRIDANAQELTYLRTAKTQNENKIRELKKQIDKQNTYKDVTEITAKLLGISKNIEKLRNDEPNTNNQTEKINIWQLILSKRFLEIIIIILSAIILFEVIKDGRTMQKDIKSIKENTEQEINANIAEQDSLEKPDYSNLSIDIEGYSNGYLEKGKQYICTIKDFPQNADTNIIKYEGGDNCKIIPTDYKLKFKIEPKKDKEHITLKVLVKDEEVCKRQIPE